jgi:hypothetical protein
MASGRVPKTKNIFTALFYHIITLHEKLSSVYKYPIANKKTPFLDKKNRLIKKKIHNFSFTSLE